jgi:hypothetical protein
MSYMSSNPYILNIVPLFNVASSVEGGTTAQDITASLGQFSNYFNFNDNILYTDGIQPFTDGGTITITGTVNVDGTLEVNGVPIGADTTTGTNSLVGSNIVIESSSGIMTFFSTGNVKYTPISTGTTNFQISSSILRADRAAIGTNGTSALSTIFDVWSGDAYFDQNVGVRGDITCQTLYQVSDERLKSNTRWMGGGALSTLMELRGVRYDMGGNAHIGFLAQEVDKVVPEAVSKQNPGAWMIDYSTFIPLIVEAIKELASCR